MYRDTHTNIQIHLHTYTQLMISGDQDLNIKDWQENTVYKDCKADDNVAKWFWQVCVSPPPLSLKPNIAPSPYLPLPISLSLCVALAKHAASIETNVPFN